MLVFASIVDLLFHKALPWFKCHLFVVICTFAIPPEPHISVML